MVLIREGLWATEVAATLDAKLVADKKAVLDIEDDPSIMEDLPPFIIPSKGLEGYLYPETYDLPPLSVQSQLSIGTLLLVGSHIARSSSLMRMHWPEATVQVVQPVSHNVTPDAATENTSFTPAVAGPAVASAATSPALIAALRTIPRFQTRFMDSPLYCYQGSFAHPPRKRQGETWAIAVTRRDPPDPPGYSPRIFTTTRLRRLPSNSA
jgi:hypothetical protein